MNDALAFGLRLILPAESLAQVVHLVGLLEERALVVVRLVEREEDREEEDVRGRAEPRPLLDDYDGAATSRQSRRTRVRTITGILSAGETDRNMVAARHSVRSAAWLVVARSRRYLACNGVQ